MAHHAKRRRWDHDLAILCLFIRPAFRRTVNINWSPIPELAFIQHDPLLTLHISV
jgi:hypothetical protein